MDLDNTQVITQEEQISSDIHYKEKPVYETCKRIFDVVCSLLAIIVLSPVFLIVALIIVINDFGSPFFVQERIGRNNKAFRMIKFRSMYMNVESKKQNL